MATTANAQRSRAQGDARPRKTDSTPDSQRRRHEQRARKEKSVGDYIDEAFVQGRREGKRSTQRVDEERVAKARRGAFTAGQADARKQATAEKTATRDAAAQAKQVGGSGSAPGGSTKPAPAAQLSAPTTTIGSGVSGGIDRTQGSRLILVITGLSAILAIANSARQSSPTTSVIRTGNGETVKVPAHLQSLGGVFVVGTICLVLNEVSPGIAVALSAMLGIDLLATAFGKGGVANAFGSGLFRGVSQVGPIPAQGKPGYLGSGTSNTTQAPGSVPSGLQPPIGVLPAPSGSKDAQTATPKRSASPTLPEKVASWLNVIGI
jgi:hypothetical protein